MQSASRNTPTRWRFDSGYQYAAFTPCATSSGSRHAYDAFLRDGCFEGTVRVRRCARDAVVVAHDQTTRVETRELCIEASRA